jgi:nucleotide-binding universal stress UspA family protein
MMRILVPLEKDGPAGSILETAVMLARKFDSYVEGFAVRTALTDLIELDGSSASLATEFAEENIKAERDARSFFERFMQDRGISRAGTGGGLSYGWLAEATEGDGFVGSYGRVFDLTVIGRPNADPSGSRMAVLEVALFESGHPVLVAPPIPGQKIGKNILIAWNCSSEQARATTFAMPILEQADQVTVLTVEGGTAVPGPAGAELCRYLQSHGIPARSLSVGLDGRNTGEAILAHAGSLGCDLLIKGAYTQSRLRQMIFGGATRHILAHATLPVLMAH